LFYGQKERACRTGDKGYKTGRLSKKKGFDGIYANRAFGCNRYYSTIDVDIDAGARKVKETGKGHYMPGKPETMGFFFFDVHRG